MSEKITKENKKNSAEIKKNWLSEISGCREEIKKTT